ncbi:hypothetical protein H5410_015942 [Solanum commersonii]|uniref:Glycosyltransferase N-terminal domain-containing protein n=1 Tax=Solanum commersonii TaxID=4109 RepID=A0A9J5ZV33_SOLCO|nr:hypothetical protein H5410_015942 [Solanum commersonii]
MSKNQTQRNSIRKIKKSNNRIPNVAVARFLLLPGIIRCRRKHTTTPPNKYSIKMDPLPHVIIFPFPAQGHVNSMLKLAHLLSLSNFDVTFLVTVDTHDRLLNHTDVLSRVGSGFHLQALPHGISMDGVNTRDGISMLYYSLNTITKPFFRESIPNSSVTCLIVDGILSMAADVA